MSRDSGERTNSGLADGYAAQRKENECGLSHFHFGNELMETKG